MIRTLSHALTRRLLLWLLAFALPAQAMAGAIAAVHGPAHVHRPTATAMAMATVTLEDFRRAPAPGTAAKRGAFATFATAHTHAHTHAFGLPQQHHHARADASVVKVDAGNDLADADEGVAPATPAVAFLALLPAPHGAWHAGLRASLPAPARDARFSTRHPAPPDKPPRMG